MRLFSTLTILLVLCLSLQAQYTERTLTEIRENDADGSPVLLDASCEVTGIVHSPTFRTSGIQFVLIDADNVGVTVFSSDYMDYNVTVGDELKIQGAVGFFNGLTEVIPDNIEVLSQDNALQEPTEITALDESTESQLVIIRNVMLVDESDWTGSGSGFNVDVTDGTNNYVLRIDNNVDAYDLAAPQGTFDVIGVGGQFDSSAPYDSGYQLFPRGADDLSVEIDEPEEPVYTKYRIAQVTDDNNEEEIPDSLGVTCELQGVVYGINLRSGNDLQFTIIDEFNDGIGIFSPIDLGYTVQEGDLVSIKGEITFFNGLTQIFPAEINLISTDNPLFPPSQVTSLGEDTESQLVQLPCVELTTPEAWSTNSSAFPVLFTDPISGKGYIVQVDEQTDLHDAPAPEGLVRITGIGWQNDNTIAHNDNYALMPRYITDIESCAVDTKEFLADDAVMIYPNPVNDMLNIKVTERIELVAIYDSAGKQIINVTTGMSQLDTTKLPKGMYSIVVHTAAGMWVNKLTKQ